jgi:uncharacterized protein with ParB-like and HNH nuclease domain
MRRMPKEMLRGGKNSFTIDHFFPDGGEARFSLPNFQRPFVWSQEQQSRFIESAWLGFDIGSFVVTGHEWQNPLSDLIIDGQQRLTTLGRYLNGDFSVFGFAFPELDVDERRHFRNSTILQTTTIQPKSEALLRELYNRLNFGGTPHTEEQRA